ncbi:fibronectin type III domain-containing protein [Leucobacter luti]|uniref:Purple acid phosphatase-like protein n=1 Tax=Leucobacter luti TaxID=340320 RepID=A0A4V6MD61_9MICO|nr:fibronectin type III domain-containing protein [Leucobacter luti]MBL3699439.1 metallophosphoesterase family protein [Leucobacter luti]RZT66949.1 purple acid phosphatase-like protein [Leucobacter luti]
MSQTTPAARARRGGTALALAALLGGSLLIPTAAAAVAPEVPTAPLVGTGTSWQYLDDHTDPARGDANVRAWVAPEYDDSGWKTAPGGFGVKNNALVAVGPYTPATKLEHYIDGTKAPTIPTYFFRTSFDLEAGVAEQVASLTSTVIYDDALVVWVNGTKVASYEDQRITETTNLEYAGNSNGDPLSSTFSASGELLRDGENTIAVALYQDRASSSDAYFDMSTLTLTAAGQPGEVVEAPPTRVILTPTETPETSQSFSWLAGDATHNLGQVEIGLAAGGETRAVDAYAAGVVNGNPNQHFSATVEGLTPGTDYRYRVGLPGSWSEWIEFTTADPAATDFQFVYYGDAQIGLDSTWPEVVRQAEARTTNSIGSVHAGDLIDSSSNEAQWLNWFKGMKNSAATTNVMAAPGNHEYTGDKLLSAWKANFEYPRNQPKLETIGALAELAQGDTEEARQAAAYFAHWSEFAAETVYYTDYQGVRFITLNATRDTTFLTPSGLPACAADTCPSKRVAELWTQYQAAWLDFILAESPSKWNVVTFHQPVFSGSSGRDEPVLRKHWVPVFEKHNIDLVLMGHDHVYARGFVNATATDVPGLTSGPVYAVSNSGAKHYSLAPEGNNVWTNNGATQVLRGEGVTTYQVIDVSSDQLVYRSYLAEKTAGATTDKAVGDLYDEFTVTKYATGAKYVTEAGVAVPAGPALRLELDSVAAGAELSFSGSGFAPGSELAVELRSDPVSLGAATVQADGSFAFAGTIPSDTPAGAHQIVVILPNGAEIAAALTVTPAVDGGTDGGATDGGATDGGATDGGATDGGATDGGPTDGGATDGGATDGGSTDAGTGGGTAAAHGGAKSGELASTGGAALPFVLGGAGLLVAGAAILLARRRAAARQG